MAVYLNTNDVEKLKKAKKGEIIYLTGDLITARDCAYKRIEEYIKNGKKLPFKFEGSIIFHAGPIVDMKRKKIIAIGSTTSARMNSYIPLMEKKGVVAVIGKGGMDKMKVRYLSYTGGCAAIASHMLSIKKIHWKDLSMAEAVFELKAEKFGPMIVLG